MPFPWQVAPISRPERPGRARGVRAVEDKFIARGADRYPEEAGGRRRRFRPLQASSLRVSPRCATVAFGGTCDRSRPCYGPRAVLICVRTKYPGPTHSFPSPSARTRRQRACSGDGVGDCSEGRHHSAFGGHYFGCAPRQPTIFSVLDISVSIRIRWHSVCGLQGFASRIDFDLLCVNGVCLWVVRTARFAL